ncbi:hypothetical protein [Saccharobesus litoralis]|nr:hypothetical protein [Saccharobesus litoralis]
MLAETANLTNQKEQDYQNQGLVSQLSPTNQLYIFTHGDHAKYAIP